MVAGAEQRFPPKARSLSLPQGCLVLSRRSTHLAPGSGPGRAVRRKRMRAKPWRLVEAFVFEGFFGLLVFALVFGASGFAAPKADPVFRGSTLVFGALALLLVFV